MRKLVKGLLRSLIARDGVWHTLDRFFMPPLRYIQSQRDVIEKARERRERRQIVEKAVSVFFPTMTVRDGPFRGMRYADSEGLSSDFFLKLLGMYECELHDAVEEICEIPYDQIINVGSAEGYYAVGLALRIPSASVIAIDTNPEARRLCRTMAEINGVTDRLVIEEQWSTRLVRPQRATRRVLMVWDCEGCESQLLEDDLMAELDDVDLLVETHDFVDRTVSVRLCAAFSGSHDIRAIISIDDALRLERCAAGDLAIFDERTKSVLLNEQRPERMSWLFMNAFRADVNRG